MNARITSMIIPGLLVAACLTPLSAADEATLEYAGEDIAGKAVAVPAESTVTVLVFAMADQSRSQQAMSRVQTELASVKDVQMVAVVSGADAEPGARALAKDAAWPGAMLADKAYKLSGAASVHVWPTVVVVDDGGTIVGHVAGLPSSLARDLRAYVDFAAGRLDADQLKAALEDEKYVASTQKQAAARHVEVAHRLIDRQQYGEARRELQRALELSPDDASAKLGLIRVAILQGHAADAVKMLNELGEVKIAAWRVQTLRGRALLDLGQHDEAQAALLEAVKLNPQPSEAYYLLGRSYEQSEQWQKAADAYRSAYEYATENAITPDEQSANAPAD